MLEREKNVNTPMPAPDKSVPECAFCNLPDDRIAMANDLAIGIRDGFPVSNGHTLVIPKRHVGSFFETTPDERKALFDLLDAAKNALTTEFQPAAYNIGINDGPAAGQTVPHLHIHLIPRYADDDSDPRGGIRKIFPKKANYWE